MITGKDGKLLTKKLLTKCSITICNNNTMQNTIGPKVKNHTSEIIVFEVFESSEITYEIRVSQILEFIFKY